MGIVYVKVFLDWREATKRLKDAEKGRLVDAMIAYANGENPDSYLSGNEAFVFPMFQLQIDRDRADLAAYAAKQSENGRKGGRPRKATDNSENPENPPVFSKTQKSKEKDKEEEKDKEKDQEEEKNSSSCAAASATPDESEVFFRLPTVDGKEYPVTWTDVDKAKQLYPAVDIEQEIRNMYGWLDGHQSNRKTWGGMKRFINSWLARAQNNAHVVQQKPQPRQVVNAFAEYAERLAREGAQ
jgi:hypothetical protein